MKDEKQHWALDKKVNMSLIIATTLQIGAFTFWVGGLSRDIDYLKDAIVDQASHSERIVRLETEFENISNLLNKIDRKLDNLKN